MARRAHLASDQGMVYDKENLTPIREFGYLTEGWGITSDGREADHE